MTQRVLGLVLVTLCLVVVPLGSATEASPVWLAQGSASGFSFEGATQLASPMRAFRIELATGDAGILNSLAFRLEAESARFEVDYEKWAAGTPVAPLRLEDSGTNLFPLTNVRGMTGAAFSPAKLWILPLPGSTTTPQLKIASTGGDVALSSTAVVRTTNMLPNVARPAFESATSTGLAIASAGATVDVQVEGSFLVGYFGFSLEMRNADNSQSWEFWTGQRSGNEYQDPTGRTTGLQQDLRYQQVYAFVDQGRLEFPGLAPGTFDVFADTVDLALDGGITLRSIDGQWLRAGEAEPIRSKSVQLNGKLESLVRPAAENRMDVAVGGQDVTAQVNDRAVTLSVPVARPLDGRAANFAWLLLAAVPPIVLVGRSGHRRMHGSRLRDAEILARAGDDEGALRLTRRLVSCRLFRHDARAVRIEALARQGKANDARALLEPAKDWPGVLAATREYYLALIDARTGEDESAVTRLTRCLSAAPEFKDMVRVHKAFAEVRKDRRLIRILESRATRAAVGYE